jgi:thiamine biosynthesis lipoprotein ApbE
MQYKNILCSILLCGLLLSACARSEKLDDNEMQYVKMTISLTKARIASRDSLQLQTKLDSVYKKFESSKELYKKRSDDLGKDPERAGIIFRAVADSLNIK